MLIKCRRRRRYSHSFSILKLIVILACITTNAVAYDELLQTNHHKDRRLQLSDSPTGFPSSLPTIYPTESYPPTWIPSRGPSISPTAKPVSTDAPSNSHHPTTVPSNQPTESPTSKPSRIPTVTPTSAPSITAFPSLQPTQAPSPLPSAKPTLSLTPSSSPSNSPSSVPTLSSEPSSIPSSIPSSQPTYSVMFEEKIVLITTFISFNEFNDQDPDEVRIFNDIMSSYTPYFGQVRDPNHIDTMCKILSNTYASSGSEVQAIIQYSMEFKSNRVNITGYDDKFFEFIRANSTMVVDDFKNSGMKWNVDSISFTGRSNTKSPTSSPSHRPSAAPTGRPSKSPSSFPTFVPSDHPSISQAPNERPSNTPTWTAEPSTGPTSQPTIERKSENLGAIVGGTIGAAAFIVLFFLGRRRRRRSGSARQGVGVFSFARPWHRKANPDTDVFEYPTSTLGSPVGIISDNHSSISRDSLLSASSGHDDSDSDIEYGGNSVLHDEFEKYKDENMEKMRKQVVESLTDCGDMVNLALTKALMDDLDDDEENDDITSPEERRGIEIEATVLCEMTDWMKKTVHASADERREIMQGTLNDMVSNVRRGVMSSDDGSRIIHGAAAILGLQLEANIPETTVIVTGMRKKATRKDMVEAFKEFGEIEDAAVSSNARGFGIVRYRSPKSVQRAMDRFRTGEIVVQDVAIMIRVLKPDAMSTPGAS
jgi:hypothetical protein